MFQKHIIISQVVLSVYVCFPIWIYMCFPIWIHIRNINCMNPKSNITGHQRKNFFKIQDQLKNENNKQTANQA